MKKFKFAVALGLAFLMTVCGNANKEENKKDETPKEAAGKVESETENVLDEALDKIHADESFQNLEYEISTEGCAVAFLGYFQGDFDELPDFLEENGYLEKYPFLEYIPEECFVEAEGDELFCVIPSYDDVSIAINELAYDIENGHECEVVDMLYSGEGDMPLILRGNLGSMLPNLQIVIKTSQERFEYTPSIDLSDGSLYIPYEQIYTVYDFSIYSDPMAGMINFIGEWAAHDVQDGDGNERVCILDLYEDGTMVYAYGEPMSEFLECFEGTWSVTPNDPMAQYPPGYLVFHMEFIPERSSAESEPYEFWGLYDVSYSPYGEDSMVVRHVEGNPLLWGKDYEAVVFFKSVG